MANINKEMMRWKRNYTKLSLSCALYKVKWKILKDK